MNISIFFIILMICEVLVPLVTEAVKLMLDSFKIKYASNVVCAVSSVIITIALSAFYIVGKNVELQFIDFFYIFFLIAANWIGSMLGYDKVKQAIAQINEIKR